MSEQQDKATPGKAESSKAEAAPLYGLLAEYDTPAALIRAARLVRDAGFRRWDTYTPFPVHGIEPAMGIKPTVLPWIVFGAGVTGCVGGLVMQWWMNAFDYAWLVSGKPFWSVPANIPIIFEMTVLLSAFAALGGMLMLNGLPLPSHPLDFKRRFARATDDRFFLVLESADRRYEAASARRLLDETEALAVEEVHEDRTTSERLPRPLIYGVLVLVAASFVPFALFAKARVSKSRQPAYHVVPDMDFQPKVKAQTRFALFDDQRGMRQPPEGTVPYGELQEDDLFYRGRSGDDWAREFPEQVTLDDAKMERGRERFGIYCAPCHGLAGDGDGMVAQRAEALQQGTWVPPSDLHQAYIREQPVGQVFNTITHGIRNMPAYGPQIVPDDRWAIVLYVRALQRSRAARLEDVPAEKRESLRQ